MNTERKSSRRRLIFGALAFGAIAYSWQRFGVRDQALNFQPLPGLNGWTWATSGDLTSIGNSTSAVFLGLGEETVAPIPSEQLCGALYQSKGDGTDIAVFTDFFCPNCRVMDAAFLRRDNLNITWHELPLLGRPSELVARAMLAADVQGAYLDLKEQLAKAPFRPSLSALQDAANSIGIEAEQFIADMDGPAVRERLERGRALAETLAIWGTPAFTLGQKLILGRVSGDQLDALLAEKLFACETV